MECYASYYARILFRRLHGAFVPSFKSSFLDKGIYVQILQGIWKDREAVAKRLQEQQDNKITNKKLVKCNGTDMGKIC